jgi:hypothetical protein
LKIQAVAAWLAPFADKVFVGSGAENHREFLKSTFSDYRLLYRSNFLASEIGKIALQRFRCRQYAKDLQEILPLYIRKSDAESNLAKTVVGAVD